MHWHLDYFRGHCEMIASVPIRTSGLPLKAGALLMSHTHPYRSMPDPDDIEVSVECALADAVRAISSGTCQNLVASTVIARAICLV